MPLGVQFNTKFSPDMFKMAINIQIYINPTAVWLKNYHSVQKSQAPIKFTNCMITLALDDLQNQNNIEISEYKSVIKCTVPVL